MTGDTTTDHPNHCSILKSLGAGLGSEERHALAEEGAPGSLKPEQQRIIATLESCMEPDELLSALAHPVCQEQAML